LFGFSRGAYTAKAIAGMIHFLGLTRPEREGLAPLGWAVYSDDGQSLKLSRGDLREVHASRKGFALEPETKIHFAAALASRFLGPDSRITYRLALEIARMVSAPGIRRSEQLEGLDATKFWWSSHNCTKFHGSRVGNDKNEHRECELQTSQPAQWIIGGALRRFRCEMSSLALHLSDCSVEARLDAKQAPALAPRFPARNDVCCADARHTSPRAGKRKDRRRRAGLSSLSIVHRATAQVKNKISTLRN